MRYLIFIILLVSTAIASAQTRVEVYPDDRMIWSDMLLHAENGMVREGRDWRGIGRRGGAGVTRLTFLKGQLQRIRDNKGRHGHSC